MCSNATILLLLNVAIILLSNAAILAVLLAIFGSVGIVMMC